MPAKSKAQQRFMGMVHAYKKGDLKGSEVSKAIKKAAKGMKKKTAKDYASTKHTDKPERVKSEVKERDYKAEYKKFQSSTKSKKYRAELNKYNRQKGTYGNGDGKDASHKGGKIVGFEAQSKNRGRAEKSRLKKEIRRMVGEELMEGTAQNLEKQIKSMGSRPKMGKYGDSDNDIRQMSLVFSTPEEAKRIASKFSSKIKQTGASVKFENWSKLKGRVIGIGHLGNRTDRVIDAMSKKPMQLNKLAMEIAKNTTDKYAYVMNVETDFDEEVAGDTIRFNWGSGEQKKFQKEMEKGMNESINEGRLKKEIRRMIKEELSEAYRTPDELGVVMRYKIDELSAALKKAEKGRLGPEGWAEKYFRSAPKAIEMVERLIGILRKM